jgi:hypothetical protein
MYSLERSVCVCVKLWNRDVTLILRVREYLPWQLWKLETFVIFNINNKLWDMELKEQS